MTLARTKLPELGGENVQVLALHLQFLLKFGLYGEALELPGNFFNATSKYSLKSMKKNVKIKTLGRPLTYFGKLLAPLCTPSCRSALFV